jgi:hypothetical protein
MPPETLAASAAEVCLYFRRAVSLKPISVLPTDWT